MEREERIKRRKEEGRELGKTESHEKVIFEQKNERKR